MAERPGGPVPPQNLEAETAVLGAMLLVPQAVPKAFELLKNPAVFYLDQHRHIYQAMTELFQENRPIDLLSVTNKLRQLNRLDAAGGMDYVAGLAGSVPSAAHLEEYARIVHEKYLLRQLAGLTHEIQGECYRESKSAGELLDRTQSEVCKLASTDAAGSYRPLKELLKPTLDELQKIHKRQGGLAGVDTGFTELNKLTLGLRPGQLVIVAGRPSMGKTALGLNIAVNAAKAKADAPVLIFTLEMSAEELAKRLVSSEARVSLHDLGRGHATKQDWQSLADAYARLDPLPVYIDESNTMSPLEMIAKSRRLKMEKGLGLVIIDYLQMMTIGGRASDNRVTEIAMMTRQLKLLAKELKVPVMVISQLSRASEKRENTKPVLSDLRESGAIEQDADLVLLIYRPQYYKKEQTPPEEENLAEVIVAKQRNGPSGETVRLTFLKEYAKFENMAAESPAGGAPGGGA